MSSLPLPRPIALATALLLLPACPARSPADTDADPGTGQDSGGENPGMTSTSPSTTGADASSGVLPTTAGNASSDASSTGISECLWDVGTRPKIPRVMLVLDKSGSMVAASTGFWDADGDDADDDGVVDGDPNMTPATPRVTRWSSLHQVVESIVTTFAPRMELGAALFPAIEATKSYDASACPVHAEPEVAVGSDQGAAILAAIPGADDLSLHGGTPAAAAITTAVAALPRDERIADPRDDLRAIVLVTDGAANCATDAADNQERFESYDEQLPLNVAAARAAGVPTFVVGLAIVDEQSPVFPDGNPDATNTFVRLNELAELGGQARPGPEKFHNTRDQIELQAALAGILEAITSCTLELTSSLPIFVQVDEVVVETGGDPLVYGDDAVRDCDSESGWRFTDATRTAIELCGDACVAYKTTGLVDVRFECVGR